MKSQVAHLAFVILTCYELSLYTHLAISLNRLCAVWMPRSFPKIFSKTNTFIIIFIIWIGIGTMDFLFYEYLCQAIFDEDTHSMQFGHTEMCGIIGFYGDLLKNAATVTAVLLVDIFTLIGVRRARSIARFSCATQQRIAMREKRFLKQIIFQGIIFIIELSSYFFVPQLTENSVVIFFSTTFAYVTVHVLDGLIVIFCYPEVRDFIFCHRKFLRSSSSNKA